MSAFRAFFLLEKQLRNSGLKYERAELIKDFTQGRTSSLRELGASEYVDLLMSMNQMVVKGANAEANNMRRKVIACLAKAGYTSAPKAADMERINNWCKSHGYLHKRLNEYSIGELPKLVTQAELVYAKFLEEL